MKVWTLTANPALDFTYHVPRVGIGLPHRVERIEVRPGGKGINVARVLAELGVKTTVTGFLGGPNGRQVSDYLSDCQHTYYIENRFVKSDTKTRKSIAIVDDDSNATVFNEAGEAPRDSEWEALIATLRLGLEPGDLLASCGSFPGDSSPEWMRKIVETAHEVGARVLVDATGPLLLAACEAGAEIVKPNDLELRETTGRESVEEGARALLDQGVGVVIVSEGERGMSIFGADGGFRAEPTRRIQGNPTGAGDAAVAAWCALLTGVFSDSPTGDEPTIEQLKVGLPHAVALSAAAVAMPVAGEVNVEVYREMVQQIQVQPV